MPKRADDFKPDLLYMIIFKKSGPLKKHLSALREKTMLGFVPTMGALHQGHLQLVERSLRENDLTLCSIFVNPTQFNDPEDFKKYPVSLEKDIEMLEKQGCDILFLPSVDEIYPTGTGSGRSFDLGHLELVLEGKFRPGHFQGVCRVVDILLSVVEPDQLYLGQKDYQQCMVIRKMIELTGRDTGLVICDTIREEDGLAMSSRNRRLAPADRAKAAGVYQSLLFAREHLKPGPLDKLNEQCTDQLKALGFRPDYVEFANADTLELLSDWDGKEPLVALVAAFLGDVRLIDNMIMTRHVRTDK